MEQRQFQSRAQAAMEYLMTYGWAILVIAIVVAALFALGIFNTGTPAKLTCSAGLGYLCTSPVLYTNGTARLKLGVEQLTSVIGTACTANNSGVPSVFVPVVPPVNISAGQAQNVSFECPSPSTLGAAFTGSLYVEYNTGITTGIIDKIGTLTGKVNKLS